MARRGPYNTRRGPYNTKPTPPHRGAVFMVENTKTNEVVFVGKRWVVPPITFLYTMKETRRDIFFYGEAAFKITILKTFDSRGCHYFGDFYTAKFTKEYQPKKHGLIHSFDDSKERFIKEAKWLLRVERFHRNIWGKKVVKRCVAI